MNTPSLPRHAAKIVGLSLLLSSGLSAQVATGFNQTAAGPWDYNDTANWVNGTINGVWDASLTITAAQTVTFGADTTLADGLAFGYTGSVDLTLTSSGSADQTLTLGGDITVNPASNRTITIGSATANAGLNVDLNGDRTFTVTTNKTLRFYNDLSGGDIVVTGGNPSAAGGTVKLAGTAAATASDIEVNQNATLFFDDTASGNAGTTRAKNVTLKSGGGLFVQGNNTTNSSDTISGNLIIDGSDARPRSGSNALSKVTLRPGSKNTLLSFDSLERVNQGVVFFKGNNLGANTIASATGGGTNIQITGTAPALVGGGGAAGTTTISIIPWAVGGASYSDTSPTTFVTYTAANGIRPLDINTEFASAFGGNATDNVRLTATTDTSIATDTTVNSLILSGQGGSLSGPGTLTVTSGAILFTRTTGSASPISANLNFGTAEGLIGYVRGDTISGAISGSGGLTVYGNRTDEPMSFTNGASTYTGDTTVLANMQVSTGFLPYADRTGDVYVYGNLQLSVGGYNGTINGLNGNGVVAYGNSSASSLTIGDNNANGNFTGNINGNVNLKIIKIGSGTQILAGASTYGKGTQVSAGTLLIANTEGSGTGTGAVTVASGARFGGTGIATGAVTASAADSVIVAGGLGSVGTLQLTGGLTAANGVTFAFDLDGASASAIDFGSAALTLGGTATFNFTSLGPVQTGTVYSLFIGTGDWSGSVGASFVFNGPAGYVLDTSYGDGAGYLFDAASHTLNVQFAAIPEPAACALIAGAGLLLLALRRRFRPSRAA